ncbi:MAG: beta-lactamase family protein [Gemmatimonadaceae bacterium]|nr:beta-lactamase family protein [Gemmatimonadaceae bacterium]
MHRATLFTATLLGTLAVPSAAYTQQIIGTRDARALRADSVFERFDRTDSPGCALGVYQDGKILYARGYGMASLEHGVALSPRSVLDVGSISKQFTAMSMLMLQKEGKLSLDDPIRKYIPEMPAYADRITLRRALSQTSGLRDLYIMMGQSGRTFAGDTIDALAVITRSAEPNYEPGARYLYTNTGWILAAQIVYRLTGKTLAQFADERIFRPLGMYDTRYLADVTTIIPEGAEGYAPRVGAPGFRVARSTYDGAIMGAGAVHTTVEDFGRWLNNYDEATVGGRDIIQTMTTATMLNDGLPAKSGPTQAYAIGLNVGTLRGLRVVSHGGSWAGYRGHFLRFPDQHFAVATFCNLTTSGPDSLARKVAGIYLGDRMQPDSATLWAVALDSAARADVPVASLRPLVGVWRNVERGEVRRTRLAGDTLYFAGTERTPIVPLGGGRYRAGTGSEVRFEGEGAAPSRMLVRTTGETVTYVRADSAAPSPAALAEYAGDYRSDEVDAVHRWKMEKGQLVLYVNDRRLGVLEPTYRDGFVRGGTEIDVERDAKGRVAGFVVESGRVRHLRFTRVR